MIAVIQQKQPSSNSVVYEVVLRYEGKEYRFGAESARSAVNLVDALNCCTWVSVEEKP